MGTATHFRTYGRLFAVVAEYPNTGEGIRKANEHLEAQPGMGVLAVVNGTIYLADNDDKGIPAQGSNTAGPVYPA
ncbi:hypothetical protein [Pseudomonas sp. Marseille-Q5115]|uniref:hypothetical protein n=1 Tax=Pseudomonas sp. Marseille-Q5115 TaxID=2866593 RepID=UPI001CE40CE2|nr:hypothetical protein [Pseudomonas sp. Marseille-Q5115]